jgi:hypothetical protein
MKDSPDTNGCYSLKISESHSVCAFYENYEPYSKKVQYFGRQIIRAECASKLIQNLHIGLYAIPH